MTNFQCIFVETNLKFIKNHKNYPNVKFLELKCNFGEIKKNILKIPQE